MEAKENRDSEGILQRATSHQKQQITVKIQPESHKIKWNKNKNKNMIMKRLIDKED